MKMKAAVLWECGRPRPYAETRPMTIEEVELDGPGPGEILIEVAGAGLCHSDLSVIDGTRPRGVPIIPGHEGAGIVRAIGAGVTGLAEGDHVVTAFVSSCGECRYCARGRVNLCDTHGRTRAAGTLITGGRRLKLNGEYIPVFSGLSLYAQYIVAARSSAVKIDRDVPLEHASLFGCAVLTGVGAVLNTAEVKPGGVMAVVGLGGVGMNALMGAVVAGAERIVAVDTNPAKLELARELGATDTFLAGNADTVAAIRDATDGGVDWAVETAGVGEAMELAYAITARGGITVSAGLPSGSRLVSYPHAAMVSDERTIKGSYMGSCIPARDIPAYIALYKRGKLPVQKLISGTIGLADINAGFDRLAEGSVLRQVMQPNR
jgi:alcohol dehydrogenase